MASKLFNEIQESVDYSTLSNDPEVAWLEIYETCMNVCEKSLDSKSVLTKVLGYKAIIDALDLASDALGLEINVPNPPTPTSTESQFSSVRRTLFSAKNRLENKIASDSFVNAIRHRQSPKNQSDEEDTLLISNHTLVAIHPKLQELRNSVSHVDIEEAKRDKFFEILNEFERELNTKSVSKSRSLNKLAMVGAIIVGTTTFLAEAPAALQTLGEIQAYIGVEIEDAETLKEITQESNPALPAPKEV